MSGTEEVAKITGTIFQIGDYLLEFLNQNLHETVIQNLIKAYTQRLEDLQLQKQVKQADSEIDQEIQKAEKVF